MADSQQLEQLFLASLEIEPGRRDAFLERECGTDWRLLNELQSMLSAVDDSEAYFQALSNRISIAALVAGPAGAGGAEDSSSGVVAGDVIGSYRLEREIGCGGMASVWLATRIDGLINRPVALKFPHGAWRMAGLAERMKQERDILAQLTHPNIARLYDAGVTPDGQPYLALEYVEGLPIDEYCRKHALSIPERLRLLLQVAQAVAHAHARLVVHRDLKPSNVLVTAGGEVRLLDFGIAKLLAQDGSGSAGLTAFAGHALTIDYASPEQILGQPISTASDIYSLGVLAFELL